MFDRTRQLVVSLASQEMNVRRGDLDQIGFGANENPVPIWPQPRHFLNERHIHDIVHVSEVSQHRSWNGSNICCCLPGFGSKVLEVNRLFKEIAPWHVRLLEQLPS